jgi:aspartyl/asparaginyl beta-hydroxylase (cupin superfamily)
MASADPGQIEKLQGQARLLWQQGDRQRSAALWTEVARLDPANPEAANFVGMWCLAQGRFVEAQGHLKRAVDADPEQPALWFNYAAAARGAGASREALAALRKALEHDPYFVQAIFQEAVLLEELGEPEAAAAAYQDFLATAPAEVQSDPRFEPALARARERVASSKRKLEDLIEEQTRALPRPARRAQEAVGALLGKNRIYAAEPTFFHVPRLPAIPFLDRGLSPWIEELEAAAPALIEEARLVAAQDSATPAGFVPYVENPPGVANNQWEELNHSPKWGAFFFWKHGRFNAENGARCPRTAELLERMPLIRLHGRAPNAFFSLLSPNTKIPPHPGVSNIRATVHLPLLVPPGCGFRVGAETREWVPGKAWVFDDTIEHEAWNDSPTPRLILIFDVWNPFLEEEEREYYAQVLRAYDRYKGDPAASAVF